MKAKPSKREYDPTFTMRIPLKTLAAIKKLADARGIPVTTMARMLLTEALASQKAPVPDATSRAIDFLEAVASSPELAKVMRAIVRAKDKLALERARRLLHAVRSSP